ncbi:hypothetical protein JAAARDRAFT_144152, partial [Jaapia argillacea MUCL 33604]
LPTRTPVHNIDNLENVDGEICYYIELGEEHTLKGNQFYLTNIGKENIILRSDWLLEHNPEIDWQTYTLDLTKCPDTYQPQDRPILHGPN